MSCGVGRRRGSDLTLLWLWRRPAAIVPIQPLAWEPPYVARPQWGGAYLAYMGAIFLKATPRRTVIKESVLDDPFYDTI